MIDRSWLIDCNLHIILLPELDATLIRPLWKLFLILFFMKNLLAPPVTETIIFGGGSFHTSLSNNHRCFRFLCRIFSSTRTYWWIVSTKINSINICYLIYYHFFDTSLNGQEISWQLKVTITHHDYWLYVNKIFSTQNNSGIGASLNNYEFHHLLFSDSFENILIDYFVFNPFFVTITVYV